MSYLNGDLAMVSVDLNDPEVEYQRHNGETKLFNVTGAKVS